MVIYPLSQPHEKQSLLQTSSPQRQKQSVSPLVTRQLEVGKASQKKRKQIYKLDRYLTLGASQEHLKKVRLVI